MRRNTVHKLTVAHDRFTVTPTRRPIWRSHVKLGLALMVVLTCAAVVVPSWAQGSPTWTQENPGVIPWLAGVASTDADRAWAVGGSGTIVATTDGGATWKTENSATTNSLEAVAFSDADHGWAVGFHGTIVATTDGGATWGVRDSGTTKMLQGVAFSNGNDGWAVGQDGTTVATTDGGSTWTAQSSGTSDPLFHVACSDAEDAWIVGSPDLLATTDGGSTWTAQSPGTTHNLNGVAFSDPDTGWVVGDNGTIVATTDGGSTWASQSSGGVQQLLAVAFTDANHGWAVGDNTEGAGAILATTDGGSEWTSENAGIAGTLGGVAFSDANHGWAVGYTASGSLGVILRYHYPAPTVTLTGGGDFWQAGSVDLSVNATVDSSLTLASLQYSTNGGSTWTDVPGSGGSRTLPVSSEGAASVTVRATDSIGQTSSSSTTVNIDSTTPTIAVSGNDSAWHRTAVTLTFTPTVGASGVSSVDYKVNKGNWIAIVPTGGAYEAKVSTNGNDAISYYVTNNAETTSLVGTCVVKIDSVKPTSKATGASFKRNKIGLLDLYVGKSPVGCGKAKVTIDFYQGRKLKKSFTTAYLSVNKWTKVKWKCTLAKGTYTMKLCATDMLGNKQAKATTAKLVVK